MAVNKIRNIPLQGYDVWMDRSKKQREKFKTTVFAINCALTSNAFRRCFDTLKMTGTLLHPSASRPDKHLLMLSIAHEYEDPVYFGKPSTYNQVDRQDRIQKTS